MTPSFVRFRNVVSRLHLHGVDEWQEELVMRRENEWVTYYAPFDFVNRDARLVLVGITPGLQQASNALRALQVAWKSGMDDWSALKEAKKFASFSGPMRQNLTRLLDAIGVPKVLGIGSSAELFSSRSDLVHYTSALRYPVTYRGDNYGGTPGILSSEYPRQECTTWFAEEISSLSQPIVVPLGPAVAQAVDHFAARGLIDGSRVLSGLPHPSPANAERIKYFLGLKRREHLSAKTDAASLDRAKSALMEKVALL